MFHLELNSVYRVEKNCNYMKNFDPASKLKYNNLECLMRFSKINQNKDGWKFFRAVFYRTLVRF